MFRLMFFLLSVAFYLDKYLALIVFVGFPICIYPVLKFGKKVRRFSRTGQDQLGTLTSNLQESIVGHRVVQAFSLENNVQKKFEKDNKDATRTFQKAEKYTALSAPTNEIVASIAIALTLSSPRCCCTSKIKSGCPSLLIERAFNISGSLDPSPVKLTSTTGPITCFICPIFAISNVYFIGIVGKALKFAAKISK